MVDGTRISKIDEAVYKLKETFDQRGYVLHGLHENSNQQKQLLNKLLHKISAIDTKNDQLSRKLSRDREESSYNPSVNQQTVQGGMIQTQALRLDFPWFVGNDPQGGSIEQNNYLLINKLQQFREW